MKPEMIKNTYTENPDSCAESDRDMNVLTVETQDAGGGAYVVISTERWALDLESLDEFAAELRRVIEAVKS